MIPEGVAGGAIQLLFSFAMLVSFSGEGSSVTESNRNNDSGNEHEASDRVLAEVHNCTPPEPSIETATPTTSRKRSRSTVELGVEGSQRARMQPTDTCLTQQHNVAVDSSNSNDGATFSAYPTTSAPQ